MKKPLLFLLLFIISLSITVCAQDTIINKQNKKLIEQIKEHVTIGGWIDAQYAYERNNDANQSSVMQIRRARLDFKGGLSHWVDFGLQADLANSPKLIDAFVKVNFCKYAKLQVGQFKIPFSIENKLSPLDLEFTENAQIISALSDYKDITGISSYANGREIGIMLTGTLAEAEVRGEKLPILTYGVGLFGGNGINIKTDNMAKDISARLEFCPFIKGLNISISEYWGRYNMLYDNISTGIDGKRLRVASGIEYKTRRLDVRGEYLWGATDFAIPDPVYSSEYYTKTVHTDGFYIVGSYWFDFGWGENIPIRQRLRPVLRFDYYRYDKEDVTDRASLYYNAGVEWIPEKHLILRLNYTLKQRYNIDQLGHNFTTMLTVKF